MAAAPIDGHLFTPLRYPQRSADGSGTDRRPSLYDPPNDREPYSMAAAPIEGHLFTEEKPR